MTGRELIIYILQHNLEDEEVFKSGIFIGYISEKDVAVKFEVGVETVRMWYKLGMLDGVEIAGSLYFLKDITDPRRRDSR